MTDNVILFPKAKRDSPIQSLDEIQDTIKNNRLLHIDVMLESMIPELINTLMSHGVDIVDEKYVKDVAFVMESLKSLLYKQFSLDHPFHKMVDNIFDYSYNEESGIDYTFSLPENEE